MKDRAVEIDIGKVKAFLHKKEMLYRQSCENECKRTLQILKDLVDLLILKSEILQKLEKLDRLFDRFETSYDRYSHQKEYSHTYDFDLEDEKFAIVASKTRQLEKTYKNDTEKFLRFIDDLLED